MKKMLIKGEKKFRFETKETYDKWKESLKGHFDIYAYEFRSERNFTVLGKTRIDVIYHIDVIVSGFGFCDKVV